MATTTANLGLTLPTPFDPSSVGWGGTLNSDFSIIDSVFAANGTGTSVGVNVGSSKTLLLGGTMLLGTGDGTGTVTAPTIRGPARTGSNVTGANITIDASNGTGSGGSGKIIFRTAPVAANGTTPNTFRSSLEVNAAGGIGVNTANYGTAKQALLSGGASAAANWGDVDGSVINFSGQTRGDVIYRGASAWQRLPAGTSGQFLKTNGSAEDPSWANVITRSPLQNIAAGGNEFLSIPSGVSSITIIVTSLHPTSDAVVQIGTSSGYVTTGYNSSGSRMAATSVGTATSTTGFLINTTGQSCVGTIRLTNSTNYLWVCDHSLGSSSPYSYAGGGWLGLTGILDRVRIIPSGGTFAVEGVVAITYM